MNWLALELVTDADAAEPACDLLERFGAESLDFSASSAESLFGESAPAAISLWAKTRIRALLHPDCDTDILLACLRNRIGDSRIHEHRMALLKDRDWVSESEQAIQPMAFGQRLLVSPSSHWERTQADHPGRLHLKIDPGLAFGSGSHATTRLCLLWLARHEAWLRGRETIDYGCGSGILGLCAALLGAKAVQACDTDPKALTVCTGNAQGNGLEDIISVLPAPESPEAPLGDLQAAELLLANILLGPLTALAQRFSTLVKPGGKIALSGLLHTQAEDCRLAYEPWFDLEEPEFDGEWALLSGVRKAQ